MKMIKSIIKPKRYYYFFTFLIIGAKNQDPIIGSGNVEIITNYKIVNYQTFNQAFGEIKKNYPTAIATNWPHLMYVDRGSVT